MQFGYLGVQAFFVLSGFLLTPILLDMKSSLNKRDYFFHFYGRRALRIFPLYYSYILVVTIIAYSVMVFYGHSIRTIQLDRFIQQLPWTMTYTYDFYRVSADYKPTFFASHFWSLAVEEQFYLLWPFAIFFISSQHLKRFLLLVILAGPLMRLLLAAILDSHSFPHFPRTDNAIYVLPFSHFDAFAIGGYFALYEKGRSSLLVWLSIVLVILLGMIAGWVSDTQFQWDQLGFQPFMKDSYKFVWGYSIVNLMFAFVLVHVRDRIFMPALFENRLLVYLGTISYGLYVFHFPVLGVVHWTMRGSPEIVQAATCLLITIVISMASYELMEKRFINRKDRYFAKVSSGNVAKSPLPNSG